MILFFRFLSASIQSHKIFLLQFIIVFTNSVLNDSFQSPSDDCSIGPLLLKNPESGRSSWPGARLVDFGKGLGNGAHGPCFHKRPDIDLFGKHHIQHDGIVFRQAAPGADDFRIKGHEPAQGIFGFGHAETDHDQFPGETQKGQGDLLAALGAGDLKNLPAEVGQAVGLAEFPEFLGNGPGILVLGVDDQIRPVLRAPVAIFLRSGRCR